MATIKKDTLHPENEPEVDIYPKTSIDQVENLQANLDALNGDIANVNGEIANISTNVETIANRVEIAENSITVLTTAYESYTDYTEVTNGFLLTYLSGRQIELPIKAGTNITFSKYPGSNQIIINSTGGSVPEKDGTIALLSDIPSGTSQDFSSYSDYEIIDKGFMLTYADGSKFELPIKAGTNVTFSKYPETNQIIINATGGSGGDVYTSANNTFTGNNYFNGQVICAANKGLDIKSGVGTYRFIGLDNDCGITIIKPDLKIYRLVIPDKNGTLSTVEDIPISLMYSSSRLGVSSVDFPFNIDKNYFFTITMTNTGESKSFIYAKGITSTYTIVINSSTSFEVKLNATGSSTRLIFTNKSNADPFVVRAEISN
jgi:hypothetical protein